MPLTGCGQNTDNRPGENFDTGDSSIMDGTNNPEGTTQPNDSSETSENSTENNTSDSYSWQVGGQTLTTKINVRDYIHDGSWDIKAMSEVLGYSPVEAYGRVDTRHYLNSGSPIADINFAAKDNLLWQLLRNDVR